MLEDAEVTLLICDEPDPAGAPPGFGAQALAVEEGCDSPESPPEPRPETPEPKAGQEEANSTLMQHVHIV